MLGHSQLPQVLPRHRIQMGARPDVPSAGTDGARPSVVCLLQPAVLQVGRVALPAWESSLPGLSLPAFPGRGREGPAG